MPAKRAVKELEPGAVLFNEGDEGDKAYLIQKGCIEIFKEKDGDQVVENTLHAGQIFGEMAIIKRAPRSAGARAQKATTLLVIDRLTINHAIKEAPDLIRGIINQCILRLRLKENTADAVRLGTDREATLADFAAKTTKIKELINAYQQKNDNLPAAKQAVLEQLLTACELPAEPTGRQQETTEQSTEATGQPAETTEQPAEATEQSTEATEQPAEATEQPTEATATEGGDTAAEPSS